MNQGAASGSLLIIFLYNFAEAIRLDDLRRALGSPPPEREPRFQQPAPEYVRFVTPPVMEQMAPFALDGGTEVSGRIAYYEYGIVTIQLEIPFEGGWAEIIALAARWMNSAELEQRAAAVVREHVARAGKAIVSPFAEQLSEDYYIVHLRDARDGAGKTLNAQELIEQCPDSIAQIVRGEVAQFSAGERTEILEARMSYYENDLLVVGWSAAVVYDTVEGAAPTIQLLEYANTQLLEFRHYDAVLTGLLSEVYRSLERGGVLRRWRLARDAEHLSTIRLEIRELIERLDNSIKFLSDIFAARLYRMAAARIGVPDYRLLVDQKLESAGELYGLMRDRFYHGRAFILELMVVIILVIELVLFLRGIR
jgi:hypothetical protein